MIGRGGGIRTRDPLHPMQVRYQAALRPDTRRHYSSGFWIYQPFCVKPENPDGHSGTQLLQQRTEFIAKLRNHDTLALDLDLAFLLLNGAFAQPVACTGYGEALLVQQFPDAPDQQHLMVLVIAPVAAPLDRLELGKLLLPIAQDMRLDGTQLADLTDREIALCRNRRQGSRADIRVACLHR
ncbi:protein of unknown function [Thauera humireducens]|nr:protein of unknown function [Thauera humireducens]